MRRSTGMTEPCPRCPPFVVRCGHLGEEMVRLEQVMEGDGSLFAIVGPDRMSIRWGFGMLLVHDRAEADAEFERREEVLLHGPVLS